METEWHPLERAMMPTGPIGQTEDRGRGARTGLFLACCPIRKGERAARFAEYRSPGHNRARLPPWRPEAGWQQVRHTDYFIHFMMKPKDN